MQEKIHTISGNLFKNNFVYDQKSDSPIISHSELLLENHLGYQAYNNYIWHKYFPFILHTEN